VTGYPAGMEPAPAAFAQAREQFLMMVDDLRPQLHRYCARLTGSVIEGEDIVQDTLAKAFYAMSMMPEVPPLRPWLFRIAHNAALDFLKSHGHKYTEARDDLDDIVGSGGADDRADPSVLRAALSRFLVLPVSQRSAVILKDVLGHSLEDTAETMNTTVPAVKAALSRGRAKLRETRPHRLSSTRGAGLSSIATRPCSTRATGMACVRWSVKTAGSIWSRSRSAAARPSACTSGATRRRMCGWPSFGSKASSRSQPTSPAAQAFVLHLAGVGRRPRPADPRLPVRLVHRR